METVHPMLSLLVAAFLGIFVVFVELPCTGAPYLAILGMLSKGEYLAGIPLLLLYNFFLKGKLDLKIYHYLLTAGAAVVFLSLYGQSYFLKKEK